MSRYLSFWIHILFCLFLIVSTACPVSGGIKKKLHAQIRLFANWKILSGNIENAGSLRFTINGKLEVNPSYSTAEYGMPAVLIPYQLGNVTAQYSYKETVTDKNPPEDCPSILEQYHGAGFTTFKPVPQFGDFSVQYLGGILKTLQKSGIKGVGGSDHLVDFFRFQTGGQPIKAKGKRLVNCEYVDVEKDEHVKIMLGFKIDENGKMSGQRSWPAKFDSGRPTFSIEAYDLPPKMMSRPFTPEKKSDGNTKYSVHWCFTEQIPPEIELKNVAFNFDGNDEDIVMDLKKLDTDDDITEPEWIKDSKFDPAAFVLGNPFKVKGGFEYNGKGTTKLKVWIDEYVLEGNGGFDGIEEKTIDVKNGEFHGKFKIQKKQETVGVNRVNWTWFGEDHTPGKEKVVVYLGESEHTIYIMGGDAGGKILSGKYNKYDYIVRKGCELGQGTSGGKETFDKIWNNFWNIPGPNNSTVLKYAHGDSGYFEPRVNLTKRLLKTYAGPCGAWNRFFYDINACQGIKVEKVSIHPKPPFNLFIVGQRPAQGNPAPDRGFKNHAFNAYQGKFYDPSYRIETQKDYYTYENNTIVAYCNNKDAKTEDMIKNYTNRALGNVLGNCYDLWFSPSPNDNALAECLSENSDQCAPNSPRDCELLECP